MTSSMLAYCGTDDALPPSAFQDSDTFLQSFIFTDCLDAAQTRWMPSSIRSPALATNADLPLHIQFPPIAFLDWDAADEIVRTAATEGEERFWHKMSATYRSAECAAAMWDARDRSMDSAHYDANLFGGDIDEIARTQFASMIPRASARGFVKLFSLLEKAKERRRIIGWPKAFNAAERECVRILRLSHAVVPFPRIEDICQAVRYKYAAQLDLKKMFQQLALTGGAHEYFCFTYQGVTYSLATVPTGAVAPPLLAQILLRSFCALAIRATNCTDTVHAHVLIDNARFASNDFDALCAVWNEVHRLFAAAKVTVGEITAPTPDMQPYVFLGITFDHVTGTVALGPKTLGKLRVATAILRSVPHQQFEARAIAALYGYCAWGSIITGEPMHNYYHVTKFIRRLSKRVKGDYGTVTTIWPCIIHQWIQWMDRVSCTRKVIPRIPTSDGTVLLVRALAYTDASDEGWGAVVYTDAEETLIYAGTWTPQEKTLHINVKETLAVKRLLQALPTHERRGTATAVRPVHWILQLLIDNTSTIAWVKKSRAPSFVANAIVADIAAMGADRHVILESCDYVKSPNNHADKPSRETTSRSGNPELGRNWVLGAMPPVCQ